MNNPSTPDQQSPIEGNAPHLWRLPVALAVVLLVVLGLRSYYADLGQTVQSLSTEKMPSTAAHSVEVVLQEADAAQSYQVGWTPGMNALEATQQLAKQDASLQLRIRGSGELILVTAIGKRENEGLTGLNWQYEVNGEYQNRGAAACPLSPGDRVLWKYAPYE